MPPPGFAEISTGHDDALRRVLINLRAIAAIDAPTGRVHDHGGVHMTDGQYYGFGSDSGYAQLVAALSAAGLWSR
jgi:hypothetical protein